ncbi:MAG: TetR/AcrR family transcriptional regulator [Flammeovirgaceae bacterium]
MARPKDDSKIDMIYEATLKLVLKTGFNGLKMADVAKAAKLATGTLYIYFKNKDVLINKLFLHLKHAKTAEVLKVYDSDDAFDDAFRKMWFSYLEISLREPERMLFIEQFAHTSYLTKKTKQQGDQLLEPLAAFIETGIKNKKLRHLPVDIVLSQVLGPVYEMVKLEKEGTLKLTASQKQALYEMAWNGVRL